MHGVPTSLENEFDDQNTTHVKSFYIQQLAYLCCYISRYFGHHPKQASTYATTGSARGTVGQRGVVDLGRGRQTL